MKKKIGISFSGSNFKYYWDWFGKEATEKDIELVELSYKKNNEDDISKCDGFVLTGGVDIDTSLYGGAEDYPHKETFQPQRDRFEEKIFKYSQDHRLPLLGICRGLQLVNVLQGGKLIEDLGEANVLHKKADEVDKDHTIKVEANSLLHEITRSSSGKVNSAHHQVANPAALGRNLVVNAWSEKDSIIEGLEFRDKTGKAFMLCVQWHPERMSDKDKNPFSYMLRERFIEEVKKSRRK